MCLPAQDRTLKGGRHDTIYEFFRSNGFCDKYANDEKFVYYVKVHLVDFKGKSLEKISEDDYSTIINCIEDFVLEYDEWKKQLGEISVTSFLQFMEGNNLWSKKTRNLQKRKSAYMTLCYYLGMVALDN
jgi:hypothetical protein